MIPDMSSLLSRICFHCFLTLSGFYNLILWGNESVEEEPWPEVTFPTPEERAHAFVSGEEYRFKAGWGIFRNVGKINVKTNMVEREDKEVFHLKTSFQTSGFIRALYGVDANASTYLDPIEWRLLWIDAEGQAGKKKGRNITEIDYEGNFLHFRSEADPNQNASIKLPYSHPLDFISALLQARAWDLEVGNSYPILIAGDGKVYLADIDVVEKKKISTAFGKKEAFKLVPRMEFRPSGILADGGRVAVWITNDDIRLPVLLEVKIAIGTAKLRLHYYKSPKIELTKKKRRNGS